LDRYQRAASYAERIERELRGLGVWRSAPLSDAADLDAEYLRKMEDVLAVYEKPYRAAEPVVCLDESLSLSMRICGAPPGASGPNRRAR